MMHLHIINGQSLKIKVETYSPSASFLHESRVLGVKVPVVKTWLVVPSLVNLSKVLVQI